MLPEPFSTTSFSPWNYGELTPPGFETREVVGVDMALYPETPIRYHNQLRLSRLPFMYGAILGDSPCF